MTSKRKIGFLVRDLAFGGAAKSLQYLTEYLSPFVDIIIYYTGNAENNFRIKYGDIYELRKVDLPYISSFGRNDKNTPYIKTLLWDITHRKKIDNFIQLVKSDNIDILHINTTLFAYIPKYIRVTTKVKIVFHVREFLVNKIQYTYNTVVDGIWNHSDAVIAITENEAQPFPKHSRRLYCIPNPVGIENFSSLEYNPGTRFKIGMMGAFSPNKKLELFLLLIHAIRKKSPDFKFRFVLLSGFEPRPILKSLVKAVFLQRWYALYINLMIRILRVESHIEFIGNITRINSFFDQLLVYVRTSGHPWGRDIIEAMAHGVPVCAFGESEFFVKHNKSGILVQQFDIQELADQIIQLVSDHGRLEEYSKFSRTYIAQQCSDTQYVEKIQAIYQHLLKEED